MPEEVARALIQASTEAALRAAVAAAVAHARRCHHHGQFVEDLDDVWPQTAACRSLNGSDKVTLTQAIREAIAAEMGSLAEKPQRRSEELALMGFVAELCWANYLSVSEQPILRALWALVADAGDADRVEAAVFFLARVGPILGRNPLEAYTVLQPLTRRLTDLEQDLTPRAWHFVATLLERQRKGWEGCVFLAASEAYWTEEWARARLVQLAKLESSGACALAGLPPEACDLIAEGLCTRCPMDSATLVWVDDGGQALGVAGCGKAAAAVGEGSPVPPEAAALPGPELQPATAEEELGGFLGDF